LRESTGSFIVSDLESSDSMHASILSVNPQTCSGVSFENRPELSKAGLPRSMSLSEASTDDEDTRVKTELSPEDSTILKLFVTCIHICNHTPTIGLLTKLIRMLRTCKYSTEDITSVFALCIIHHKSFIESLNKDISATERAFILVAQLYISHCVVLDEYCCISNWHKYLFSTYCDLRSLNNAVARILKRMEWRLTVDQCELESYIKVLRGNWAA
jgi:hypothetical protein